MRPVTERLHVRDRQRLALVLTLVGVGLALVMVGGLLLPFVVALLLGLLLDPLVGALQRTGLSRGTAAGLVTVAVTTATIGAALGVAPFVIDQVAELIDTVRANVGDLVDRLTRWWSRFRDVNASLGQLLERAAGTLAPSEGGAAGGAAIQRVLSFGGTLANVVVFVLLVPLALYFLLKEGTAYRDRTVRLLPARYHDGAQDLARAAGTGLSGYLRGQGLVCGTQALIHATGLALIGLDFGILIGLLTGASAVVPIIGNTIMFSIALLVAVIQFDGWAPVLAIVALYGAAQLFETIVLVPFLIGRQISLHPLLMIVALLVGGSLFGLVGALLALPATAVLVASARWGWQRYEATPFYRERPAPHSDA